MSGRKNEVEAGGQAGSAGSVRRAKVQALVERAGSPGEQEAARGALVRLGPSTVPKGVRLSDAICRRLAPPAKGQHITWDDPAGFGLRVTAAGAKSFVLNYRTKAGRARRVTIGAFPTWSTSSARDEARRLKRLVDQGEDPLGVVQEEREAPTMMDLADRFEREHVVRKRPATQITYCRLLRLHIKPFFGRHSKVADVGFADVDALHRKVTSTGSTYTANRCISVLSKMFSLAQRWEWADRNPCKGIERNPEQKRKRYLAAGERERLMAALAETPDRQFVAAILLLLLSGARKSEVLGMKWSDVDLDRGIWTKLAATVKQKTDHVVPLSAAAIDVLKAIPTRNSKWVFPSNSKEGHVIDVKKGWDGLLKRAGIEGLRMHDLRHSFASALVSSGASLPLVGALLGHSTAATTFRYAHLMQDPQREAVERIGALVAGKQGGRGP
jgi:integrase